MKKCRVCNELKELDDYYLLKSKYSFKNWRSNKCKKCTDKSNYEARLKRLKKDDN